MVQKIVEPFQKSKHEVRETVTVIGSVVIGAGNSRLCIGDSLGVRDPTGSIIRQTELSV